MAMPEGTRLYLLAPVARRRKGEYRKELADFQRRGFQRVKVDGKMYEVDEVPALKKNFTHDISVVVDRLVVGPELGNRLADSFETALGLADGIAITENADTRRGDDLFGQIRLPGVGVHDPRDRAAAVLVQQPVRRLPGLRRARHQTVFRPRPGRARPRPHASPRARSARGRIRRRPITRRRSQSIARHFKQSMHTPWRDLPEKMRQTILYGSGGEPIQHDL